ncbi:MAG TPA: hypothetical protein VMT24_04640 [Aggregatilineaceae bacterium]|nr:hypothetical protein [Aggregatilineaceae bacterium]
MSDVNMDDLRVRMVAILPMALIVLLVLGNVALGIALILPQWRTHSDLAAQIDLRQEALDAARKSQEGNVEVVQLQLKRAQSELAKAALPFLSSAEADRILSNLYGYASSMGVEVTDLQLQPPPEADTGDTYDMRTFRLQIEGGIPQIVGFMTLFQEASVPGVMLDNLTLTKGESGGTLTMDMLLYTSPYAPGNVLDSLPEAIRPAPMPTPQPTPTLLPPTATATTAPSPTPLPPTPLPPTPTVSGPVAGLGTFDDTNQALRYVAGSWETIDSYGGFGGGYHYSQDTNAEMQFVFVGTDIALQYVAFKNFGIFEIYVDGILWGEVDAYAPEGTFGQVIDISGLPHKVHTLTLRNTTRRNPSSEGNIVAIDAIHVLQPTLPAATATLSGGS